MSNSVTVHDPKSVQVIFGDIIKGFAKGSKIKVTPESDDVEDAAGGDGEVTIIKKCDERSTVELMLTAGAKHNAYLSGIRTLGKKSPTMAGAIMPFTIKDMTGTTVIEADNAWIVKAPEREWSDGIEVITWTFRLAHTNRTDGGHFQVV